MLVNFSVLDFSNTHVLLLSWWGHLSWITPMTSPSYSYHSWGLWNDLRKSLAVIGDWLMRFVCILIFWDICILIELPSSGELMHSRSKELVKQAYFWNWTFLSGTHEHINGHFYCIPGRLTVHIKRSLEEKNKMCAEVLCQLPKANDESNCDLFSTPVHPHSPVIHVLIETSKSYFTYKVNITSFCNSNFVLLWVQ